MHVTVPISVGELLDKITILEIKAERIADPAKLANIRVELEALDRLRRDLPLERPGIRRAEIEALVAELGQVNRRLWEVEDLLRDCERAQDFGPEFVRLARAVYKENDLRARLKRRLNAETGSALVEEKSYSAVS
jgi:hypothetical protein